MINHNQHPECGEWGVRSGWGERGGGMVLVGGVLVPPCAILRMVLVGRVVLVPPCAIT